MLWAGLAGVAGGALAHAAAAAGGLGRARPARGAGLLGLGGTSPEELAAAFQRASGLGGDLGAAEAEWGAALGLAEGVRDPSLRRRGTAAALSNRGAIRLQAGDWTGAREDLKAAIAMDREEGQLNGATLNNLGNAEGAEGDWEGALERFREAAGLEKEMQPIALANLALGLFQVGRTTEAVAEARSLVRKDPAFWDMYAALASFLWASGDEKGAEAAWNDLCVAGGGEGGPAGETAAPLGALAGAGGSGTKRPVRAGAACELYAQGTGIVSGRWPPRAIAALDAFLKVSREGAGVGYDGQTIIVDFRTAAAGP